MTALSAFPQHFMTSARKASVRTWPIQLDTVLLDTLVERVAARPGKVQLLRGPSGIGKTTLASAVTRRLADEGRILLPVIGVRELASIPLAAMAPVLALGDIDPGMSTADRVQRLFGVVAAQRDDYVLAVDDAPLLDEVSASTVYQLVRIYGVRCVMTARSSDPIDGPLQRLLDDELVEITELDGLSRTQAVAAVEEFFETDGGAGEPESHPAPRRAATRCFCARSSSPPNPATGIGQSGNAISIDNDRIPPRIADAVGRRFADLSPDEQRLIELLAVAEPLPAGRLGDPRLVRRLVEQQVIEVKIDQAYLAHPIVRRSHRGGSVRGGCSGSAGGGRRPVSARPSATTSASRSSPCSKAALIRRPSTTSSGPRPTREPSTTTSSHCAWPTPPWPLEAGSPPRSPEVVRWRGCCGSRRRRQSNAAAAPLAAR